MTFSQGYGGCYVMFETRQYPQSHFPTPCFHYLPLVVEGRCVWIVTSLYTCLGLEPRCRFTSPGYVHHRKHALSRHRVPGNATRPGNEAFAPIAKKSADPRTANLDPWFHAKLGFWKHGSRWISPTESSVTMDGHSCTVMSWTTAVVVVLILGSLTWGGVWKWRKMVHLHATSRVRLTVPR